MMTLFSIKVIFWEQVTFSENSGLTFFQNFLLSQTIEGLFIYLFQTQNYLVYM